MAELWDGGIASDLRKSLMILVMVGSTVSKHSRRSDVGMGSSSHDLGAHFVMTECK